MLMTTLVQTPSYFLLQLKSEHLHLELNLKSSSKPDSVFTYENWRLQSLLDPNTFGHLRIVKIAMHRLLQKNDFISFPSSEFRHLQHPIHSLDILEHVLQIVRHLFVENSSPAILSWNLKMFKKTSYTEAMNQHQVW